MKRLLTLNLSGHMRTASSKKSEKKDPFRCSFGRWHLAGHSRPACSVTSLMLQSLGMNYSWGLTSAINGGKICLEHKEERQSAIMAFSLAFTTLVKSMATLEIVPRDCPSLYSSTYASPSLALAEAEPNHGHTRH